MDAAHYGHRAGATDIIFHPGSYFGGAPQAALDTALPRLRACVRELRDGGNPAVTCVLTETTRAENMAENARAAFGPVPHRRARRRMRTFIETV
jgi:endonuclease IV